MDGGRTWAEIALPDHRSNGARYVQLADMADDGAVLLVASPDGGLDGRLPSAKVYRLPAGASRWQTLGTPHRIARQCAMSRHRSAVCSGCSRRRAMAQARHQIHGQSLAPCIPISEHKHGWLRAIRSVSHSLLAEFATADIVAVALAGSYARGDATRWSDVDIIRYATTLPATSEERYTLAMREGRLVSVSTTTIATKQAEMTQPATAIFVVPGLRQARILHDPTGALAALHQQARDFTWEPLRAAANAHASETVMGDAEEIHKLLGALGRRDESAALYATHGLVLGLTRAVAVGLGVLIESENSYYRQTQEAAGADSAWTRYHRIAAGFVAGSSRLAPATSAGIAALHLYRETAHLLLPLLVPRHVPVIEATLELIAASGLALTE